MTFNNFPPGGYTYSCNFSTPPQSNSFHDNGSDIAADMGQRQYML